MGIIDPSLVKNSQTGSKPTSSAENEQNNAPAGGQALVEDGCEEQQAEQRKEQGSDHGVDEIIQLGQIQLIQFPELIDTSCSANS